MRELRLSTVFQGVSAAGLRWAAQHCPGLSTVDLSGCSCLSDDSIEPLGALSLTSLSLARLPMPEYYPMVVGMAMAMAMKLVSMTIMAI